MLNQENKVSLIKHKIRGRKHNENDLTLNSDAVKDILTFATPKVMQRSSQNRIKELKEKIIHLHFAGSGKLDRGKKQKDN